MAYFALEEIDEMRCTVRGRTVFRNEHSIDNTTCFSGHVATYVIAFTPFVGSTSAHVSWTKYRIIRSTYLRAYTSICSTK